LRTAIVLAFWSFHIGLFALLELGLFPFVCVAAWGALLPGWFWDRLGIAAGAGPPARRKQWLALACLFLVLASNLRTLAPRTRFPPLLSVPLRVSGLYQKWSLFAPNPIRGEGWVVVVGKRVDGADEDLLHGGPVSWSKPAEVSSLYPNWRWASYMRAVAHRRPPVRKAFAGWLCRRENAGRAGAARIANVTFHYLTDVRADPGDPPSINQVQIWDEVCAPEPS
jgi:hypothetical protein